METTNDTLFSGQLVCRQHEKGYRFSIDSILLAHFVSSLKPESKILDLCSGSGVIGLVLAYRNPEVFITGLELQASLARLAEENIRENELSHRCSLIKGDARYISKCFKPEMFDVVVCNPPYRKDRQTDSLTD